MIFQLRCFILNWCKLSSVQLTKILEAKNNLNKDLYLSLDGANFEVTKTDNIHIYINY